MYERTFVAELFNKDQEFVGQCLWYLAKHIISHPFFVWTCTFAYLYAVYLRIHTISCELLDVNVFGSLYSVRRLYCPKKYPSHEGGEETCSHVMQPCCEYCSNFSILFERQLFSFGFLTFGSSSYVFTLRWSTKEMRQTLIKKKRKKNYVNFFNSSSNTHHGNVSRRHFQKIINFSI